MKISYGILLFRSTNNNTEYFLVHPGGPYFKNKNEGLWTIPKGESLPNEIPLTTAIREFEEETGYTPIPPFIELLPIIQKGGKKVFCWAAQGDLNPDTIKSNTFTIEWPPKSGKQSEFPEIDRAGWFSFEEAKNLINEKQIPLLEQLNKIIKE
ncbi:NUDIX domain-containing protein [Flavobacterium alkalisoli]|uniref:NUDIX domain-containing protein n=1 Tax=Flavobacterium alkalisoli TaxID=2602769 RepID=A0A5B9FQJ6_9FLAO|nr:NUDIX domain-containing protein [Flavobacterium alkalisoli]QEE49583.1 NUDIX domain-containing protein [Flavobacterium alkalisoli]